MQLKSDVVRTDCFLIPILSMCGWLEHVIYFFATNSGEKETNLPIFRKFFVKIIFFCKFFMSSDTVAPFFLLLIKDTNCTNLLSILHYFTLGMEA